MEKFEVWGMMVAVSFLGAIGNILLKIGINKWGLILPSDSSTSASVFDTSLHLQFS